MVKVSVLPILVASLAVAAPLSNSADSSNEIASREPHHRKPIHGPRPRDLVEVREPHKPHHKPHHRPRDVDEVELEARKFRIPLPKIFRRDLEENLDAREPHKPRPHRHRELDEAGLEARKLPPIRVTVGNRPRDLEKDLEVREPNRHHHKPPHRPRDLEARKLRIPFPIKFRDVENLDAREPHKPHHKPPHRPRELDEAELEARKLPPIRVTVGNRPRDLEEDLEVREPNRHHKPPHRPRDLEAREPHKPYHKPIHRPRDVDEDLEAREPRKFPIGRPRPMPSRELEDIEARDN